MVTIPGGNDGLTVIITLSLYAHPLGDVPFTTYLVSIVGDTTIVGVAAPVFQRTEVIPEKLSERDSPGQIPVDPFTVIDGTGSTLIISGAELFEQPN